MIGYNGDNMTIQMIARHFESARSASPSKNSCTAQSFSNLIINQGKPWAVPDFGSVRLEHYKSIITAH